MRKLLRLCVLPALLCILSLPTSCDTSGKNSLDFDWIKFPSLTVHSSQKHLDNYVQSFQRQGFVVVSRQQEFSKTGLVSFHFRAVHPSKDLPPGNTGASVEFT